MNMNEKKRSYARALRRLAAWALFLLLLIPYIAEQNDAVVFTPIDVHSKKLPKAFDGLRILHLSDLHNKDLGRFFADVLRRCADFAPDAVCVTGDLIDTKDMDAALAFIESLTRVAPVYYVPGNHERQVGPQIYGKLRESLRALGVTLLEDRAVALTRGADRIDLVGVRDPAFDEGGGIWGQTDDYVSRLYALRGDAPFAQLLAHRPEHFEDYARAGYDLTLSGHEHGGLIRFPFVGALVGLNQGFLPSYTAGLYRARDGAALIVSRGIGNNPRWARRIHNPPEIVLITLHAA